MNQGTKWALLMQKKRRRKSHAWAPLSIVCMSVIQQIRNIACKIE
jgi:hypothetical protein